MSHPFAFRPGTGDQAVFEGVNAHDEYRLPAAFEANDLVVDVGMHIGSFSYACLMRGAGHVHGFEAFVENYRAARGNLRSFGGRITAHHRAVWRSDRPVDSLPYTILDPGNLGAGHVLRMDGPQSVPAIGLDALIRRVTDHGRRRVRLLKLDCEGAEYPILFTSKLLHLVDAIHGEYHNYTISHGREHPFYRVPDHARVEGFSRFTIDELDAFLTDAGFEVEPVNHPLIPGMAGWFFARNAGRAAGPATRRRLWSGMGRLGIGRRKMG